MHARLFISMGEYGERNLPQSDQEGEYPSVSLHLGGHWYTRIACAPNKYGRRQAWIILENGERVSLYLRP